MKDKFSHILSSFRINILYRYFVNIIMVLFVPSIIIVLAYFNISMDNISNKATETHSRTISNLSEISDNILANGENIASFLAVYNDVEKFCYHGMLTAYEMNNIITQIVALENTNEVVDSIWIYSERHERILNFPDEYPDGYEANILEWIGESINVYGDENRYLYNPPSDGVPGIISAYVPVVSSDGVVIGCVISNLNIEKNSSMFSLNDDYVFAITIDDELVYSNDAQSYIKSDFHNLFLDYVNGDSNDTNKVINDSIYTVKTGRSSHIYYYLEADLSLYYDDFRDLLLPMIINLLVVTILALIISFFIARKTARPILNLLKIFTNNPHNEKHIKNEEYLMEKVHKTIAQNYHLQEQLTSRMQLLQNSQMVALQTQINPHFLYNTLENIKWNAMDLTGSENDVSKNIQDLGKLLRYSLSINPPLVPFEQEYNNINLYLDIVNIGNRKKVELIWDYDENVKYFNVPRLLLQPIIENSVQHGLRFTPNRPSIYIRAYMKDSNLIINIKDNGVGMTAEELEKQRENLTNINVLADRHIGLMNVMQRIRLIYGEESNLTIQSSKMAGTNIIITIVGNKETQK